MNRLPIVGGAVAARRHRRIDVDGRGAIDYVYKNVDLGDGSTAIHVATRVPEPPPATVLPIARRTAPSHATRGAVRRAAPRRAGVGSLRTA